MVVYLRRKDKIRGMKVTKPEKPLTRFVALTTSGWLVCVLNVPVTCIPR